MEEQHINEKKIKKISDRFFSILGIVVVIMMILVVVFKLNSFRYLIYSLIITLILHFRQVQFLQQDLKNITRRMGISLSIIYLIIISVFSVSPFLTIQEFRISHPNWKQQQVTKIDYSILWDSGYKRKGNIYVDVIY